jgi:hypothetical protein
MTTHARQAVEAAYLALLKAREPKLVWRLAPPATQPTKRPKKAT